MNGLLRPIRAKVWVGNSLAVRPSFGLPIVLTYGQATSLGAWRQSIAARCAAAMDGAGVLAGPVAVRLTFRIRRPRGHYGARGTITPKYAATDRPTVPPDIDKLVRAALDAMTGIPYRDGAQVAALAASKVYAEALACWSRFAN